MVLPGKGALLEAAFKWMSYYGGGEKFRFPTIELWQTLIEKQAFCHHASLWSFVRLLDYTFPPSLSINEDPGGTGMIQRQNHGLLVNSASKPKTMQCYCAKATTLN